MSKDKPGSPLETKFLSLWTTYNFDLPLTREVQLIPKKKYRYDVVHYPSRVAIEINGGNYSQQRLGHSTGAALNRDYKKSNLAQLHGFTIFVLDTKMIDPEWVRLIGCRIRYLTAKKENPI